ncbi:MAG: dienelactone hydrolase family protein [Myxococcota bacterium]
MDALEDFAVEPFAHEGRSRDVLWKGEGPGVLVMTEVPGITPEVADFARRLADRGYTVALPDLFGRRGVPLSPVSMLRTLVPLCVSREWLAFARQKRAPVTNWLRALATALHGRCGGRGVGVVGMCFTGGFALALAVEPAVRVPVMSQPSLPLGPFGASDLHMTPEDLEAVKGRLPNEGLCAIGLRFTGDIAVPRARFARLEEELGEAFIGVEIDSGPDNPHGFGRMAHSVLTAEFRDEPGHPTRDAYDLMLEHFERQLR